MRLLHLTAVGADRPPASLEFAPRLTVIYGASETGKTYVIDALDFMLAVAACARFAKPRDTGSCCWASSSTRVRL
jgi:hypothetical protein